MEVQIDIIKVQEEALTGRNLSTTMGGLMKRFNMATCPNLYLEKLLLYLCKSYLYAPQMSSTF